MTKLKDLKKALDGGAGIPGGIRAGGRRGCAGRGAGAGAHGGEADAGRTRPASWHNPVGRGAAGRRPGVAVLCHTAPLRRSDRHAADGGLGAGRRIIRAGRNTPRHPPPACTRGNNNSTPSSPGRTVTTSATPRVPLGARAATPLAAARPAMGSPAAAGGRVQLELLFDISPSTGTAATGESHENDPESAAPGRSGDSTTTPPAANGHPGGAPSTNIPAIPVRCPVVGMPVCYYGDCRHYQSAGCAHPAATAKPKRRRPAAK